MYEDISSSVHKVATLLNLPCWMMKCKAANGDARWVQAAPKPLCILATDYQLQELEKNCTNSYNFGVLSLDPTFDFGKFYVTPMVFPLRMFYSKRTGKSPYYIGPLLIHRTLKEPAYHYFCSQLVGMRSSLCNVLSVGTDGEKALSNAVCNTFTSATHLRCFKHVKDNIEEKLRKDLNIAEVCVSEILNDILGYKVDGVHFLGLVDAKSEDDFLDKLAALKSKWDSTEDKFRRVEKGAHSPPFHAWFVAYQSNVMMKTMITPVRQRAELGTPPDPFYTNPSESINCELKRVVDRRPCDLSVFIEKMFSLVQQQNDCIT